MFKLFNKRSASKSELNFSDLDGNPLHEGDEVVSLRYELGRCRVITTSNGMAYRSVETGEEIHWSKMVDAVTRNQKVRKIS